MSDDALVALRYACAAYPTQRLGQVIANALGTGDHFYLSDAEATVRLWTFARTGRPR